MLQLGPVVVQWELGEKGRNVYRSYRDLLIHAVTAGALLLWHKGCIRCARNVEELS